MCPLLNTVVDFVISCLNCLQRDFLHTLQTKKKWAEKTPNIQAGDVVLLKNTETHRGRWPLGIVERTFPGSDGLVRKVSTGIVIGGSREK